MSDDVRDHTECESPDVWIVWNDYDYYGPDFFAVCRTRDAAMQWVRDYVAAPDNRWERIIDFYVEGVAFADVKVTA